MNKWTISRLKSDDWMVVPIFAKSFVFGETKFKHHQDKLLIWPCSIPYFPMWNIIFAAIRINHTQYDAALLQEYIQLETVCAPKKQLTS